MPRLHRGFTGLEILTLVAFIVSLVAGTAAVSNRTQKFLTSKKAAGPGAGCWGSWDCDGNSYCGGASGQPGEPNAKMGVCVAGENRPRIEEQIVQEIQQQNLVSEAAQKVTDALKAVIAQKPKQEPAPAPTAQPNTSDTCNFCGGLGQGACDQGPPNYCSFGCKSNYAFCKLTGSCLPAAECKDAAGSPQTDVGPASSNPAAYAEKLQQDQQARFDTLVKGAPQDQLSLCKDRGCGDCSTPEKIAACLTGDFSDENKKIVTEALAAQPAPAPQTISATEKETIDKALIFSQKDCPYCRGPSDVNTASQRIIEKLPPAALSLAKILLFSQREISDPLLTLTDQEKKAVDIIKGAKNKLTPDIKSDLDPDQTYIKTGKISSDTAVAIKNLLGDTDATKALINVVSGQLQSQAESINYSLAAKKLPPIQDNDKATQLAAEYGLSADATKQLVEAGKKYAGEVKAAKLAAEAQQKITSAAINLSNPLGIGGSGNEILANLKPDEKKKAEDLATKITAYSACRTNICNDQLASLSQFGLSSDYLNSLKENRDRTVAAEALQKVKTAKEPWQEIVNLTPDQQKIYDTAIKADRLLNLITTAPDSQIIDECNKTLTYGSCFTPQQARLSLISTAPADQKQFLTQTNSQIVEAKKLATQDTLVINQGIVTSYYGSQYQTTIQCQGNQLITTVTQIKAGATDPIQKPSVGSITCPFGCSAGACSGHDNNPYYDTSVNTELAFLKKQCEIEKKTDCSDSALKIQAQFIVDRPNYKPQLSPGVIQTINTASLDDPAKNLAVETKYQQLLTEKKRPCGRFGVCTPLALLTNDQLRRRAEQYVTQAQTQASQISPGFSNQQSFDYLLNVAQTQGAALDPGFETASKIPIFSIFTGFYDVLFNQGKNVVPVIFNKAPQPFLAASIRGLDQNLIVGLISGGSTYGDSRNPFFQAREIQETALPACGIPANAPELSDLQKTCLQAQVNALKFKWANIETQNRQNAALQIGSATLGLLTGGTSRVLELSTKAVLATNASLDIANAIAYANLSTQGNFDYAQVLKIQADSAPVGSPQQTLLHEQAVTAQTLAEQTRNSNILTGLVLSGVTNFGGYKLGNFIQGPLRETASQNPFTKAVYNVLFDLSAFKPARDLGEGFYVKIKDEFYSFRRTDSGFLESEGTLFVYQNGQVRSFSVKDPLTLSASSVPNGSIFITESAMYQKTGSGFIRYEIQHVVPIADTKFQLPERVPVNDPNIIEGEIIRVADTQPIADQVNSRLLTDAGYIVGPEAHLSPDTLIAYRSPQSDWVYGTLDNVTNHNQPRVLTVQATGEQFLYFRAGSESRIRQLTPPMSAHPPPILLGSADVAIAAAAAPAAPAPAVPAAAPVAPGTPQVTFGIHAPVPVNPLPIDSIPHLSADTSSPTVLKDSTTTLVLGLNIQINGQMTPVVAKGYKTGNSVFQREIINAQIVDQLGVGPKFRGLITVNGIEMFVVDQVPGLDLQNPDVGKYITSQTFRDIREIQKRYVENNLVTKGDFQIIVTPQGRAQIIDTTSTSTSTATKSVTYSNEVFDKTIQVAKQARQESLGFKGIVANIYDDITQATKPTIAPIVPTRGPLANIATSAKSLTNQMVELAKNLQAKLSKPAPATPAVTQADQISRIISDVHAQVQSELANLNTKQEIIDYITHDLESMGVEIRDGTPRVATKEYDVMKDVRSMSEVYVQINRKRPALAAHEWEHVRQIKAFLDAGIPTGLTENKLYTNQIEAAAYATGTKLATSLKTFDPVGAIAQPFVFVVAKAGLIGPLNAYSRVVTYPINALGRRHWPQAWADIQWPWVQTYEMSGPNITPRQVKLNQLSLPSNIRAQRDVIRGKLQDAFDEEISAREKTYTSIANETNLPIQLAKSVLAGDNQDKVKLNPNDEIEIRFEQQPADQPKIYIRNKTISLQTQYPPAIGTFEEITPGQALEFAAILDTSKIGSHHIKNETQNLLKYPDNRKKIYAFKSPSGQIIGIAFISENSGSAFLSLLMVGTDYQQSGVGTAIIYNLKQRYDSVSISAAVPYNITSNTEAEYHRLSDFYKHNGLVGAKTWDRRMLSLDDTSTAGNWQEISPDIYNIGIDYFLLSPSEVIFAGLKSQKALLPQAVQQDLQTWNQAKQKIKGLQQEIIDLESSVSPQSSTPTQPLGIVFNPFDPNFPLARVANWIGQNITIPLQIKLGIRYEDSQGNLHWWLNFLGLLGLAFNGPACNKTTYIVWPGDNLTKIAKRCNMTLDELIKLNNISDPNNIQIGQILIVNPNYQSPVQPPIVQSSNLREQNQTLIEDVANKYHVPRQYLDAIWGVENDWRIPDYAYCQQQCNSNQSCGPMQITPSTQGYVDPQITQDICTLNGAMEIAARILIWKKYCLANSVSQPACAKISAGDFTGMSLEINRNINIYNPNGRPLSPLIAVGRYNGNDCYPFSASIYRWGIKPDGSGYTYCDAVQHIIDQNPLPENMGPQRTKYDLVVKCVNAMYAEKDLTARKKIDCSYLDGFENRPRGWWTHLIDSSISPADTANLLPPNPSQP